MSTTRVSSKQQFAVTNNLDLGSLYKIINCIDPTQSQDVATKAYVDATKQGLDIKDSVRVAATVNITTLSGTQTIDSVALSLGDRVLLTAQTTGATNGIYVVAAGAWTRSVDADTSAKVTSGLYTFASEGTLNGGNGYVLTTPDPIVLGTTVLSLTQFSGAGQIIAGAGLTKNGNTIDVNSASNTRIVVNADNIDLANTSVAAGTYASGTYGNGTGTAYQVATFAVDSYGRLTSATNRDLFGSGTAANLIFASPNGASGAPTFRSIVQADIPGGFTAAIITSGILSPLYGGTGVNGSAAANGTLLIGNGTGYSLATLTQGTGISVVNAAGTITISNTGVISITSPANQVIVSAATGAITLSLPQSIAQSSTPTFAGVILTTGSIVASTPYLSSTQTWNSGATIFTGELVNITDTASSASSKFVEYQISGTAKYSIRKDGTVTVGIWNASVINPAYGGTGLSSYVVGDILYATGATTLASLADVATGNVLISGGVGAAPSYGKVGLTTHISGILSVANGGTGIATVPTNGQIPIGNGSTYIASTITGSTNISVTNGAGSIILDITTTVLKQTSVITKEVPTGTVNSVNATFTLAFTPVTGTEEVYVNGVQQDPGNGNDYTISGVTITFLTGAIPQTGDKVRVSYFK